jgi:hypothetical protein
MSSSDEALSTCAWCNSKISEDNEVIGMGARVHPSYDLSKFEGKVMPLTIESISKTLSVVVPTKSSPARADGNDIMIMTCSIKCSEELKDAVAKDRALSETLDIINRF